MTKGKDVALPATPIKGKATGDEKLPLVPTPEERPDMLAGITEKVKTGYGNLYVTVNMHDGRPFEVFAQIGKSGYSTMADSEAICRMVSLALRSHIPVKRVIEQLAGIGGANSVYDKGTLITSIPDAIAKVLSKHFDKGTFTHTRNPSNTYSDGIARVW